MLLGLYTEKSHLALQGRSPGGPGVHRGACRVDCARGSVLVTLEEGHEPQHLDGLLHAHSLSRVQLGATPRPVAPQALLSMGCSRQEYRGGLSCPAPGDLPEPGTEPAPLMSSELAGGFFIPSATWECWFMWWSSYLLKAVHAVSMATAPFCIPVTAQGCEFLCVLASARWLLVFDNGHLDRCEMVSP